VVGGNTGHALGVTEQNSDACRNKTLYVRRNT
jgi:hypothetical protein